MKLKYDSTSGAFTLYFNEKKSAKSKMITDDCILKFDADGHVIAIEMLDAPKHDIDVTQLEMIDVSNPDYQAEIIKAIKSRASETTSEAKDR